MALRTKSHDMGMHTERLSGRTQQRFFEPDAEENFTYPGAYDVDFNKRAEFDAALAHAREHVRAARVPATMGSATHPDSTA